MTTRELEDVLREDAPRPSAGFATRMEERVAQGFPRQRRPVALPRLPRPALAGLASAALALSVTAALLAGGGEDERGAPTTAAAPEAAPPETAGDASGGAAAEASPPLSEDQALRAEPGPGIAPGESERHVERAAELTLAAPAERLPRAAEEVVGVADRHGGFVLRSEIRTGEDGGGGEFELRIPQDRLRAALRDLSAIGEVRARSERGRDVTPVVSRTEERLEEARAERRGLLRRLERADGDDESRAIRRRLRLVSAEIRAASAELRRLRERVDYAAVAVTLEEGGSEGAGAGGGGPRDALADAVSTLEAALALAIRALGVLVPLSLLGAAGLLATRVLLRRRREAALS